MNVKILIFDNEFEAKLLDEILNETLTITEINLTVENIIIQTMQYQAVLGQPVKWKKQIIPETTGKIEVSLPQEAENISINKIKENEKTETSKIPSPSC